MRIQKRRPLLNRSEHVFLEGAFMVEGEVEEEEGNNVKESSRRSFPSPIGAGDRLQLDTIIGYPVLQLYSQSWIDSSSHGYRNHGYLNPGYYYNHGYHPCDTEEDPPNFDAAAAASSSSSSAGVKSEVSYENKTTRGRGLPFQCREVSPEFSNPFCAKSGIDLNLSAPSSPAPLPFYTFAELFKTARDEGGVDAAQPALLPLLAESNFEYASHTSAEQNLSLIRSLPSICRSNKLENAKAEYHSQGLPCQNELGETRVNGFSAAELANNNRNDCVRKGRQRRENKGNNSSDKANKASVGQNEIGKYPEKEDEEGAKQCNRKDGRGWQCSQLVKEGSTYCEHHLVKIKANHARSAVKMAMLRKKLKEECTYNPAIINNYSHRNNSTPIVPSSRKRNHHKDAYSSSSFDHDGQQTYEKKKMKMTKKNSLEDADAPIIFWFDHPPL